jgi:hypothetical protein
MFHRPALPGVSESDIRCTHPSWLRWDAPVYYCRLSMAHDLDRCKVSMMIPFDPTETWSRSIIGSEPDTGIEMMAHITLTSLYENRHTDSAALPIALLPIWYQENPVWQQRLEVMSDLNGPHFHTRMTWLAMYVHTCSTSSTTPPGQACSSVRI